MKKLLFSLATFVGFGSLAFGQASIDPNNGNRGQSLPIIISGQSGIWSSQGTEMVVLEQGSYTLFSGTSTMASIKNVSVVNPNTITADLHIPDNAPTGSYNLFVQAGTSTMQQQAFHINQGTPSALTSTPGGAQPGDTVGMNVNIPGASFKTAAQGIHSAWLSLDGELINTFSNIQVIDSETFTADVVIPASATEDFWDINVYTNAEVMHYGAGAFEISNTFSIEEPTAMAPFTVFPNPGMEELNISYQSTLSGKADFRMLSLSGVEITPRLQIDAGAGKATLDVSELSKGIYIVQMLVDNEVVQTRKWMKK